VDGEILFEGQDLLKMNDEQIRRVRGNQSDVVLIALTGYGQESDRERSRKAGFDHHFVKPTDPRTLCDVLHRSVTSRESSRS